MIKNHTPRGIALFSAAILSIFVLLLVWLAGHFFLEDKFSWIIYAGLTLVVFIASYLVFLSALETFIYRKIKLIYKTIHNLRLAKSGDRMSLGMDIISEVNQEVLEWAEGKKEEIEQLKKLETFRREFIGNVSHELKTPIFSIQGYIHTLLDGGVYDSEINIKYLRKAAKNIDRLSAIVEDLDIISRLESGELILEIRSFDIYELTRDVFESLEIKAAEMKIMLGFKKGSDKPFMVRGDKDRIRQVLINLVSNSIKYGKEGGATLVGFYDMDEKILVDVTDNGIGMDEEYLSRIFERFYRVDKSRSRERGGTGLGLSIVKHIIEAQGQTINVRSKPDFGSTFAFTLDKAE